MSTQLEALVRRAVDQEHALWTTFAAIWQQLGTDSLAVEGDIGSLAVVADTGATVDALAIAELFSSWKHVAAQAGAGARVCVRPGPPRGPVEPEGEKG
jgi:hypothetical protein